MTPEGNASKVGRSKLMSVITPLNSQMFNALPVPSRESLDKLELLETDDEPLESDWYRMAIGLLVEPLSYRFRDREDYYAGGNSFIYYSEEQVRNKEFLGADFFF